MIQKKEKTWEELDITNYFIFGKVMQNLDLCQELLEHILQIKIERIEYPNIEKHIKLLYEGKGVRLDVYVADITKSIYSIEMQASDTKEIPKRSRFYQGIIDMELLEQGQSYNHLKKSFIIFLCTFDLFDKGRCCYTFEERCIEDPTIALGDDTTKIFINTKGLIGLENISEELKEFLYYIEGNTSDNPFVQKISHEIDKIKENQQNRSEYMNQIVREHLCREEGYTMGYDAGIERGIERGIEHGKLYNDILLIRKKLQRGLNPSAISDLLEMDLEKVEEITTLFEKNPTATVDDILKLITRETN